MSKYFGTDGFRGHAGKELTAEHAFLTGRYLGHYLKANKQEVRPRVVIGKDTRLSGYMLEYSISAGLASSGVDVYLMRVTTTPSVSYVTAKEGFDTGIMITASHNPFFDNGIKLLNDSGEKIDNHIIDLIENYIDSDKDIADIPYATDEGIGRIYNYSIGREKYIDHITSIANGGYHDLKIGIDTANGSASKIAPLIFKRLGADVFSIGDKPNGTNINTVCGSTHPESLAQYVKDHSLNVGFAFDGDADRCIAIDENGEVIDGDKILYILTKRMIRLGIIKKREIVTTVMSNGGLLQALDKIGIASSITNVGDRFVYEKMQEVGASLGGEQSGHIIMRDYATTGDGILTAVMLAEEMIDTGLPLSHLANEVKLFPQLTRSIHVKDKAAALMDVGVLSLIQEIKIEFSEVGRLLVRESGTEPKIRIMVEAKSIDICNKVIDRIAVFLDKKGYVNGKPT